MKRRQTRRRQSRRRKSDSRKKQQFFSRKRRMIFRRYKGGADLAVPEGSVISVDLDPKDPYSVPVLISKRTYEEEVLED